MRKQQIEWRAHQRRMQRMRNRRRKQMLSAIKKLKGSIINDVKYIYNDNSSCDSPVKEVNGEKVECYRFLINRVLEVFPSNRGYRDVLSKEKGRIPKEKTLEQFIQEFIQENQCV